MWLTLTLNGAEHWLFGLEYYYSSLSISLKIQSKPQETRQLTYRTKVFWYGTICYAIL